MLKTQRMDMAMPRAKRKEMMQLLGYEYHPALRDGRCSAPMPGTTERPVLYIKRGHWASGLKTGREVMTAYAAAQMPGALPMVGISGAAVA
jgi:hypothetical protein